MFRCLAGSLFILTLNQSLVFAEEVSNPKKHFVFSTEEEAQEFVKQQKSLGKITNLTTQKQPGQHYFVFLKGYSQWSTAFKQAQMLGKHGFSDVEVSKGRFERGYSVLVSQSVNKKKAGEIFNKLRGMGLRNVKVHTDVVSVYRYIVSVPFKDEPKQVEKNRAIAGKGKVKPLPLSDKPGTKDEVIQDEEIIIVMSDTSNATYEVSFHEDGIDDEVEWGANFTAEHDSFSRDSQDASHSEYVHGGAFLERTLSDNWDFKLSARVDGTYQNGKNSTDYSDTELDYGDTYIRYRDDSFRVTVGAQTIRWGKVDNLGPLDNMATLDLSRGVLLKWGENYRSSSAIRIESFVEAGKFDFVYLPKFREAELADKDDVWYPIDFRNGRMLGFEPNPVMMPLIQNAKIDDDIDGDGGLGLRYSTTLESFDLGLTVQHVRLSTPYYRLNENIRQELQNNPIAAISNASNYSYTFKEEHPRNWIIGADAEFEWKKMTWRMEAGWFSDLPATTRALKYETYDGFQWAASAEFYPGDADTRVNLQLSGRHIDEDEKIVDLDNVIALSGEVESLFANNRWKVSGRFNVGLSEKDIVVSPEVAYLGVEPFEVYTAFHYLDGDDQTIGGFYQYNNMVTFGIRGKY